MRSCRFMFVLLAWSRRHRR